MDLLSYLLGKKAGGGSGEGSMIEYKTEEQEIGTWIDGKKVYMKVMTGTVPTDSAQVVILGTISADLETIISCEGYVHNTTIVNGVTLTQYIPFLYMYNPTNEYSTAYIQNGDIVYKTVYANFKGKDFHAVVIYTKKETSS